MSFMQTPVRHAKIENRATRLGRGRPSGRFPFSQMPRKSHDRVASFVAPLRGVDIVEGQGFFGERGSAVVIGESPGGDIGKVGVVAKGFAFGCLVFLAEMAATG